eukprot:601968-Hanusia_phi.AAC.1
MIINVTVQSLRLPSDTAAIMESADGAARGRISTVQAGTVTASGSRPCGRLPAIHTVRRY